jgi:hypothetical protein
MSNGIETWNVLTFGASILSTRICIPNYEEIRHYKGFKRISLITIPLLKRFMRGVDALLFAYGVTSAGKTFTVQGNPEQSGLIPRMLCILLSTPAPRGTERGFLGSCVEVYNERLINLFGESNTTHRIGKDEMGLTSVNGANEVEIRSEWDVTKMQKDIEVARRQCST